jgi:hypothetical protein
VWSKTLDSAFGGSSSDSSLRVDIPALFHLNRALANQDRTHNFQLTNVWELPFGAGRKWLSDQGVLSYILGGWQVNNIISWLSGTPFNADGPGTSNCGSGCDQRADLVGTIRKLGGIGPGTPYWDPSAFGIPASGTIGTAGYNILRSPTNFNWDFGIFRVFSIQEDLRLELRGEIFNFTNHPQFTTGSGAFASNDVDDSNFLEIDEGREERVVRIGLRLVF